MTNSQTKLFLVFFFNSIVKKGPFSYVVCRVYIFGILWSSCHLCWACFGGDFLFPVTSSSWLLSITGTSFHHQPFHHSYFQTILKLLGIKHLFLLIHYLSASVFFGSLKKGKTKLKDLLQTKMQHTGTKKCGGQWIMSWWWKPENSIWSQIIKVPCTEIRSKVF